MQINNFAIHPRAFLFSVSMRGQYRRRDPRNPLARGVDFVRRGGQTVRGNGVIGVILLLIGFLPVTTHAAEQNLAVIQLSNRNAGEMVDLVRPFLDSGGTVVASGTKLIVRTSPENMAEVQELIEQLDKRLAQFRISVLQSSRRSLSELNASAGVNAELYGRGGGVRAKGYLYQTDSKNEGELTQQVQAVEGKPAHIQVGRSFPVPTYATPGHAGYPYPSGVLGYQDATSGFAVIPRLAGNEVLLEISPWSDRLARPGGGIVRTQSAHTTIRAPIGQWVSFGGRTGSKNADSSGILSRYESTGKNSNNLFIKVERIR